MPRRVRVLVADDYEPIRSEIVSLLEEDGRFDVCAQAADAAMAIQAATKHRPDVAVLDVRMPGGGLAALWEISARFPEMPIVMLTLSDRQEDLFEALRAGARGYLLKDMDLGRLAEAIYDVWSGSVAIPRSLVTALIDQHRDATPHRRQLETDRMTARLTSRQWQILDLLAQGLSTAQIAGRLVLTQSAVRAHIAAIVRKCAVRDRDEAVAVFTARSPRSA
jgi:DNA-binding NarL/FixJ family response regulator